MGRRHRVFVAIDDGRHRQLRALALPRRLWSEVHQGAEVRATVSPRLHWVRDIDVIGPPRPDSQPGPAAAAGGWDVGDTAPAPDVDGAAGLAERAGALATEHAEHAEHEGSRSWRWPGARVALGTPGGRMA